MPHQDSSAIGRATTVVEAAHDKGGVDTVVIDVGDILGIADLFVITSGTNTRQIRTIVDEIQKRMKESWPGETPRMEGLEDLEWVLVDFGDVVVHVFDTDARDLYDLERLWADAPVVGVAVKDHVASNHADAPVT